MIATLERTTDRPTASQRPYTPHGACLQLWRCKAREAIISGPAGTGKSRAALEVLHVCAEKYPGMRGLIFRKRRKDLTESGLVTWETKVLPENHASIGRVHREGRHVYRYPNGSEIVVGGMDDPSKVMSTEYDIAFGQEARELDEADWESVSIRCRNGRMPYQQVIGDTNPDAPHHWIKRRAATGKLVLIESRHEDNPVMWNRRRGTWTEQGRLYLQRLDDLTGVRLTRLRHGLWAQAEGLVYDGWDSACHVVDPFPIPRDWPRYWSVDFGFTNPFVCQWWAADPDGRLWLYRELYHTGRLVEDHARQMLALSGVNPDTKDWLGKHAEPRPRAVICDHDAEDRATLTKHLGLGTVPAPKDVSPGIQAVASRLRRAGDGKPRLVVFRGCVAEKDRVLDAARKPIGLAEEMESYTWDTETGRKAGEVPVKKGDHSLDAARYLVYWLDGPGKVAYHPGDVTQGATTWVDADPGVW
jgi:hypothetical protein